MKRIVYAVLVLLAVLATYLAFWPVPVQPVAWNAPPAPGYHGAHAANTRLAGLTLIPLPQGESGPEHVLLRDGKLYVAVVSGRILRMNPDGSGSEVYADTGGRVLGFAFDAAGRLIAADAVKGLVAIGTDRGVTVLADQVDGDPIRYANAVVVANNGKIYFSDSSRRFAPAQWGSTFEASVLDIVEQRATGRILEYDPATKKTRVVVRGLSFPNGVALSPDEQHLYVAETGRYRIWKVAVDAAQLDVGSASAQATVLLDNLPGYPDNLMRGAGGRIWVGLSGPRNAKVDEMAGKPWLRALTLRLPRALWPLPVPYGHVFAFDDAGRIVADLQDPSGSYPQTTGVTETAERLYISNLHLGVLGWKPR